ncbi:MAG TPA: ComF family protein [Steroidobacteraceae bacterium]|nr:ComF family protein [Steroidobacteraceae bacterium]
MPCTAHFCQPRVQTWVDRSRRWLARALWPTSCLLCGAAGGEDIDLCRDCAADLSRNEPACSVCAEPLPAASGPRLCGACLRDPPPFESSFVPFRYAYPLDHLVQGLKFRNELACGRVLGELFAVSLLARGAPLPEAIVPVPLALRRYRKRGYNQAIELALSIRRVTALAVRSEVAIRQRETAEQAGLDRKARRRNVTGAFAIVAPLRERHIAILDDVVTTGSTARELAAVLRQAGAERIEVWAIARTAFSG